MKFVVDECVFGPIAARLRTDGHEIILAKETISGAADPNVLALAVRENAILLTQDRDFGELIYRQKLEHFGIILLRLASVPSGQRVNSVSQAIFDHGIEMANAFTVMTPGGIRIRKSISDQETGRD